MSNPLPRNLPEEVSSIEQRLSHLEKEQNDRIVQIQRESEEELRYEYAKIMFNHVEGQIGRVDAKGRLLVAANAGLLGVSAFLFREFESTWYLFGWLPVICSFIGLMLSLDATTPFHKYHPSKCAASNDVKPQYPLFPWCWFRHSPRQPKDDFRLWFFHGIADPVAEDIVTLDADKKVALALGFCVGLNGQTIMIGVERHFPNTYKTRTNSIERKSSNN